MKTMPAREMNPFTALTGIRSQFLRDTMMSNHQRVDNTTMRLRPLRHRGWEHGVVTWLIPHIPHKSIRTQMAAILVNKSWTKCC